MKRKRLLPFAFCLLIISCGSPIAGTTNQPVGPELHKGTYAYDLQFLKEHRKSIYELKNKTGSSKLIVSADDQGRVMTSTASGDSGYSYGWINYDLLAQGQRKMHFNPVGGEERFWMGPEGGQYALYFAQGDSFNLAHWQVPFVIDTIAYQASQVSDTSILFNREAVLQNYSGTVFKVDIQRRIELLDKPELARQLQLDIPDGLQFVAFRSENSLRNSGTDDWTKEKGLISIWLLGMMTPTPETKVIIPFHPLKDSRQYITDDYFGSILPGRLKIKDSVLYFRCDGKSRGKIGISPLIAKPMAASMDFRRNILTLILPEVDKNADYVNSKWELQKQPYRGDVINSYNDGPVAGGTQLGPFYEIESSSSVKPLKPGETLRYRQVTCHFQGTYADLKAFASRILGEDLDEIKKW